MKKFNIVLVLMLLASNICLSSIHENEDKAFFPKKFSNDVLLELANKGEVIQGNKIFEISGESQDSLKYYSPWKWQVITKHNFSDRIVLKSENLTDLTAIYEINGVYTNNVKATIKIAGGYDLFSPVFPNTRISAYGTCLYNLYAEDDCTIRESTEKDLRWNHAAAKYYYMLDLLAHPETGAYNDAEKSHRGAAIFSERLRKNGIGDETLLDLIKIGKGPFLGVDLYVKIINDVKNQLYAKLNVDQNYLKAQWDRVGDMAMAEKFQKAVLKEVELSNN